MLIGTQILMLAHQVQRGALRRGAAEALWDDLTYLLDMQVSRHVPSCGYKDFVIVPSMALGFWQCLSISLWHCHNADCSSIIAYCNARPLWL